MSGIESNAETPTGVRSGLTPTADEAVSQTQSEVSDMKAIETRYIGPTNFKGARIKADDGDGNTLTISYPYELSGEDVHRKAAEGLRDKMHWTGDLLGGSTKRGYVFVFTS